MFMTYQASTFIYFCFIFAYRVLSLLHVSKPKLSSDFIQGKKDKNSAEVDIAPAFGEITTACNVGQAFFF